MIPKETHPPIRMTNLVEAFEFVSASQHDEHHALIFKETGRIVFVSEMLDLEEENAPPEGWNAGGFCAVPRRRDLDLAMRVVLRFTATQLPGSIGKVWVFSSRRGDNRRFKQFLGTSGALEQR